MNVTFRLPSEELEEKFINDAKKAGFIGLKGHRSVGGCRASIYNAMGLDGVQALVQVHGKIRQGKQVSSSGRSPGPGKSGKSPHGNRFFVIKVDRKAKICYSFSRH